MIPCLLLLLAAYHHYMLHIGCLLSIGDKWCYHAKKRQATQAPKAWFMEARLVRNHQPDQSLYMCTCIGGAAVHHQHCRLGTLPAINGQVDNSLTSSATHDHTVLLPDAHQMLEASWFMDAYFLRFC